MVDGTIEIITRRERRRRWSMTDKLQIVSESQEAGTRVAHVAARHDVSPSLVHGWRRQVRDGRLGASGFVPVRLTSPPVDGSLTPEARPSKIDRGATAIEVILPSGGHILIGPNAPLPVLRAVIAALRG